MIDGAHGGAIAQVTAYNAKLVRPSLQEFRSAKGDIVVRRPVKPIAADRLLFVIFVGQPVQECVGRQRVMKCGIENTDVWHRGEQLPHLANSSDNHRIMQRRERIQLLHFRN